MTQMLSTRDAARMMGLSTRTLQAGRAGQGACRDLRYHRCGRAARYSVADIEAWLAARAAPLADSGAAKEM